VSFLSILFLFFGLIFCGLIFGTSYSDNGGAEDIFKAKVDIFLWYLHFYGL